MALVTSAPMAVAWGGVDGGGGTSHESGQGQNSGGGKQGNTIDAFAGTRVKVTTSGGSGHGSQLAPVDTNWKPPLCWYEPYVTPKQLKAVGERKTDDQWFPVAAYGLSWGKTLVKEYYGADKAGKKDGESVYKDYNLDQQGKGMFWHGVVNPNRRADYANADGVPPCGNLPFWVPNGKPPNIPDAISPEKLAGYAYDAIRVPDTKIELNPRNRSTVNLPTWIWLQKGRFKPVHARAELAVPGAPAIWAETTATPVGLHLDPGTEDATVHPSSGTCPVGKDGSIGTPYKKGDKGDPPCGVTYQHASNNGPFPLKATITWKVTWSGSDGTTDKKLPDGTFGTTREVEVQEVQSVVTGSG